MKRFVAIGVWGLMFGLVGIFLLTQVIAQTPRHTPPTVPPNPAPRAATPAANPAPAARRPAQPVAPAQQVAPAARNNTAHLSVKKTGSNVATNKLPTTIKAAGIKAVASKEAAPLSRDLPPLLVGLYIFLLAIFVGFELISKVPPTLHTPLMSGANAISGITIVGALYCARLSSFNLASVLGFLAVICAMINVVGGFLVTDRMLKMFRK